jgi:hypothetical protein
MQSVLLPVTFIEINCKSENTYKMKTVSILVLTFLVSVYNSCNARRPTTSSLVNKPVSIKEDTIFFKSKNIDFIQIKSTLTDSVRVAIAVYKPEKPSPIMLMSHGWHMSIDRPTPDSRTYPGFLAIKVDMRGRKYSTGKPDCNGYELYDFYDAYQYAIKNYSRYISDPNQVYFFGSSGGGGNGYAILGKFPDLFCSANLEFGISDYALWYKHDSVGEFRDEMKPWIGATPDQNPMAYASRSGITTVANILTPVYLCHGDKDPRVPVEQARIFYGKAKELKKQIEYLELKGVGTKDHTGNITEQQSREKGALWNMAFSRHEPPVLPQQGRLLVAGYVVTKYFSVFLDSIDKLAEIEYNIKEKSIRFLTGKGTVVWEI